MILGWRSIGPRMLGYHQKTHIESRFRSSLADRPLMHLRTWLVELGGNSEIYYCPLLICFYKDCCHSVEIISRRKFESQIFHLVASDDSMSKNCRRPPITFLFESTLLQIPFNVYHDYAHTRHVTESVSSRSYFVVDLIVPVASFLAHILYNTIMCELNVRFSLA